MKTNSKLTKRMLTIALAICMLCSVLVTGIGTAGLTAKAETVTEPIAANLYCCFGDWWNDVGVTSSVSADGTYTLKTTLDSNAAGSWAFGGDNQNGYEGLVLCQLEVFDLDHTVDPSAVSVSNVSISVGGTEVAIEGPSKVADSNGDKGGEYFNAKIADLSQFAGTWWTGEEVVVTFTVSGIELKDMAATDTSGTDTSDTDKEPETPVEPEKPVEEVEGTQPNNNGYRHDRGAIFIYTGNKYDIRDFVFCGNIILQYHKDSNQWGEWSADWDALTGKGIFIKYWEDYKGIGYPAVQLSWRTVDTYYLGLTLRSSDWSFTQDFGDFFRNKKAVSGNETATDGSNKWYYFTEGSYVAANKSDDAEETPAETTANPAPTKEGVVNVTGDGDVYAFVAFAADNNASDWAFQWAGDEAAPATGVTANAVKAKVGEQFTIGYELEYPAAYTWYVAPTLIVGGEGKTVDATIVAVRVDGVDVTDTIDLAAGDAFWYEATGNYTDKEAVRLAGGFNEWGTKYMATSPAGYKTIEYDIVINSIA